MEQAQKDYFVKRLNEIAEAKVKEKAVELYGPAGRPEQPTWGMVFEAIKAGEITLKEDKVDYTGPYLNPNDVVWPAMEAKKAELEAFKEMVRVEKRKAMDAVMLDAEAVAALTAFEAL